MAQSMFTGQDGWTAFEVAAALIPTVTFVWIIVTVRALHLRGVYFWGLGSTWTTIIGCPIGLVIASMGSWSGLHDPNVVPFYTPIMAGLGLYAVAFIYSIFCNYNATKSVTLAVSTTMLQQFAVLCVILLFLRWSGPNHRRRRSAPH